MQLFPEDPPPLPGPRVPPQGCLYSPRTLFTLPGPDLFLKPHVLFQDSIYHFMIPFTPQDTIYHFGTPFTLLGATFTLPEPHLPLRTPFTLPGLYLPLRATFTLPGLNLLF